MKKIAILVNEDTMQRCSCSGCLGAFSMKKDAFARFQIVFFFFFFIYEENGEEIELVSFSHSGGDLDKKLETLKRKGVDVIHLSSCTKSKNDNYEGIAERCSQDFDVVGYTHGSADGKGKIALELMKK